MKITRSILIVLGLSTLAAVALAGSQADENDSPRKADGNACRAVSTDANAARGAEADDANDVDANTPPDPNQAKSAYLRTLDPAVAEVLQPFRLPVIRVLKGLDPNVAKVLLKLEKADRGFDSLQADIEYTVTDRLEGSKEVRSGVVKYVKATDKQPPKFGIHFRTLRRGRGAKIAEKIEYAFNGEVFSIAKHKVRQVTRYRVASKRGKVETMRLGRGPFPLPFGQKASDVVRLFDVSMGESEDANEVYLKFVTRPVYREGMNFLKLDMWIDANSHLPVRLRTHEGKRITKIIKRTEVVFSDIETDPEFEKEDFYPPKRRGWTEVWPNRKDKDQRADD